MSSDVGGHWKLTLLATEIVTHLDPPQPILAFLSKRLLRLALEALDKKGDLLRGGQSPMAERVKNRRPCTGFPGRGLLRGLRLMTVPSADHAPALCLATGGRHRHGSHVHRTPSDREVPRYTPTASLRACRTSFPEPPALHKLRNAEEIGPAVAIRPAPFRPRSARFRVGR